MGLERYVVDAVVLEGRSPSEIARRHGISRSWLYSAPRPLPPGRLCSAGAALSAAAGLVLAPDPA